MSSFDVRSIVSLVMADELGTCFGYNWEIIFYEGQTSMGILVVSIVYIKALFS